MESPVSDGVAAAAAADGRTADGRTADGLAPRHWQRQRQRQPQQAKRARFGSLKWAARGAGFGQGVNAKLAPRESDGDEEEADAMAEGGVGTERVASAEEGRPDEVAVQSDGEGVGRLEGGGGRNEAVAEGGPEALDQIDEGFRLAALAIERNGAGLDNGTVTTPADGGEPLCVLAREGDAWIGDEAEEDCDYDALSITDSAIIEAAVLQLIKSSSEAAGYALASAMTGEENMSFEEDGQPRLGSPREGPVRGFHFDAIPMEVDGLAGCEEGVHDAVTGSSFDCRGSEVAMTSVHAVSAPRDECLDGLHHDLADLPDPDMPTVAQFMDAKDDAFPAGGGSDGVRFFSRRTESAQKAYSSAPQNSDSLLAAAAESLGREQFGPRVVDNALCTSLEAEGILQHGEKSFSEMMRDDGSPWNEEQLEVGDIADFGNISPSRDGAGDTRQNEYAVPSLLKDPVLEEELQVSAVPVSLLSESDGTITVNATSGQFDGSAREDLGSGVHEAAPIGANSRDADGSSRDEEPEATNVANSRDADESSRDEEPEATNSANSRDAEESSRDEEPGGSIDAYSRDAAESSWDEETGAGNGAYSRDAEESSRDEEARASFGANSRDEESSQDEECETPISNSRDAEESSRDEEREALIGASGRDAEESSRDGEPEDEDPGAPLWVKWRGKWEAAIGCRLSDCPSTTLKARPKYSKKKYVVVYFPSARLLSWVDTQHTRPISDYPMPLLSGTHGSWREAVKDNTLPRRRMLLKLGGEMLDISDRLHINAVVENSQNVNAWKAFAKDAAAATTYAELGILLVKLHLAIAPTFIKPVWMERRHARWKEDCERAASAATLHKLTKELINAVLWDDFAPLWNAPEQPELDPAWEHWKGDAFEEKDSDDNKGPSPDLSAAPATGTIWAVKVAARGGSKRFKEQARARQKPQLQTSQLDSFKTKHPNIVTLESSLTEHSKLYSTPVNSTCGESTTFRTPLVHISPSWQGKETEASGENVIRNSGLCSAFLKKKDRRCHRLAKVGIIFCGKHKHLTSARTVGEDLASEGELARWSGLCSASVGIEANRCTLAVVDGNNFCQNHGHLADRSDDRTGDDAALPEEVRCNGITGRGVQCTHKARDGNLFCVKHAPYSSNGQDHVRSEIYDSLEWTEGSAMKKRRPNQSSSGLDNERTASTPLEVTIFPAGSLHTDLAPSKSGSIEGNVVVSMDMTSGGNNFVQRKRKWGSNLLAKGSTQIVESMCSQGQGDIFFKGSDVRNRCQGTTRSGEPCSFRAPVGHTLCAKHVMTAEDQRGIPVEDLRLKAHHLFQRYLNAAEGIYSGAGGGRSMKQLLHHTKAEAAENRNVAENLLQMVTSEMSRLRTLSYPEDATNNQARPSDILSRERGNAPSIRQATKARDGLSENHNHLLEHVDCEYRDELTSPKLKTDPSLNGVATPVTVDIAEILECNTCHQEFHSHWDLYYHKENFHNCVEVKVNGPSLLSVRDVQHIDVNGLDSQANPELFGCDSRVSSSLLSSARDQLREDYPTHCKPETWQSGRFGKHAVSSGSYHLKLAVQRKRFAKIGCSDQITGGKEKSKKKNKLFNSLEKKNNDKNVEVGKEPLLVRMKAAVQTAQLRNLRHLKQDTSELEENNMENLQNCGNHKTPDSMHDAIIICSDLSNGQEPVPVVCLVERDVVESWTMIESNDGSSSSSSSRPWDTFKYITKRVLDPSLGLDPEDYKVGCLCGESKCLPESCEHVRIFDNDNLDALDIYGNHMEGRFPYDEKGRIILEEGYLVYECNSSCNCLQTCQNRVLQKGVMVRLEVFRTAQKGWAVRAAEKIPRGTFVCEYIGEVLHDQEANKRGERYDQVGCSYLYDIDAHLDVGEKAGFSKPFVIDATKFGNVARFINHSCSPNLINYQVLVDSMDCQLAHIGLFASQDIECGEELAYDYRYKLLPGKGCLCHCRAENCRGRLY